MVINRPKAKAERILVNPIELARLMCIPAATIPRCSGFTTDQIGGIIGHAADARGDVSDGRCRFRFWPVADILARSRHVGPQRQTGRGSASRLAKDLTGAGVGITSTAIIGLYWN